MYKKIGITFRCELVRDGPEGPIRHVRLEDIAHGNDIGAAGTLGDNSSLRQMLAHIPKTNFDAMGLRLVSKAGIEHA